MRARKERATMRARVYDGRRRLCLIDSCGAGVPLRAGDTGVQQAGQAAPVGVVVCDKYLGR